MTRSFVSPSQYRQGPGLLSEVGPCAARFGDRLLLVADETVGEVVRDPIADSLAAEAATLVTTTFGGECTAAEVERLAGVAREADADVVVGAGGGKAIDAAKGVRARVGGAFVSLPTVASTDAPTSGLSITYEADGSFAGATVHDERPDLVAVDTAVIARAPTRWFVSGVGDALATKFEAAATAESGGETVAGGPPTAAGVALAGRSYDVLRANAREAVAAVRENRVTDAVEATTEAIVLLSGLGFENGGLATAHALHDGIASVVETDATHGEKVCFGLLTQFALEGRPDAECRDLASFAADVGLPTTLAEVGIADGAVDAVAEAACHGESPVANQPGDPTPTTIATAMRAADATGRAVGASPSAGGE